MEHLLEWENFLNESDRTVSKKSNYYSRDNDNYVKSEIDKLYLGFTDGTMGYKINDKILNILEKNIKVSGFNINKGLLKACLLVVNEWLSVRSALNISTLNSIISDVTSNTNSYPKDMSNAVIKVQNETGQSFHPEFGPGLDTLKLVIKYLKTNTYPWSKK